MEGCRVRYVQSYSRAAHGLWPDVDAVVPIVWSMPTFAPMGGSRLYCASCKAIAPWDAQPRLQGPAVALVRLAQLGWHQENGSDRHGRPARVWVCATCEARYQTARAALY